MGSSNLTHTHAVSRTFNLLLLSIIRQNLECELLDRWIGPGAQCTSARITYLFTIRATTDAPSHWVRSHIYMSCSHGLTPKSTSHVGQELLLLLFIKYGIMQPLQTTT